jgi:hypothetical protein
VLPLGILTQLFRGKGTRDRSAEDVVGLLGDFIDGTGGDWDWDDFTSVPIMAPELEAIRLEAEFVTLPVTSAGRDKLQELLAKARALRA